MGGWGWVGRGEKVRMTEEDDWTTAEEEIEGKE